MRINGETQRSILDIWSASSRLFSDADLAEAQATKQQPTSLIAYRSAIAWRLAVTQGAAGGCSRTRTDRGAYSVTPSRGRGTTGPD